MRKFVFFIVAGVVFLCAGCSNKQSSPENGTLQEVPSDTLQFVENRLPDKLPGVFRWHEGCIGDDECRILLTDSLDSITVQKGKILCVEVEDNMVIGQRWRVADLDSAMLHPEDAFFKQDDSTEGRMVGEGKTYYRFKVLSSGQTVLRLHRGLNPKHKYNRIDLVIKAR